METTGLNVVTGAFSFTGRYIAQRLLAMGEKVITLTSRLEHENTFGHQVKAYPFNFDKPGELTDSLRGAGTLYNTYWIRFAHGQVSFDRAVENSQTLIKAAEEAGIRRIVHISITNPSEDSPFPYFRGKALVEKAITQSKLSYAIIRPTVIFGSEGILINNIAWLLRRFPIFAIPGAGDYRIQPVFVEDVAGMAVSMGHQDNNVTLDAVGPETFPFAEMVRMIARQINSRARMVYVRPGLARFLAKLIGYVVRDVVITRDEINGLMSNLLVSEGATTAPTPFGEWLGRSADKIGMRYISGLQRWYRD
jgi:uncharacterized protein YbjT (DUF2867 family)